MAKLNVDSAKRELESVLALTQDMSMLPVEVQDAMLQAEAEVVYRAQHESALKDLDERGYSTGATAAALAIDKPKGGKTRSISIVFKGKRGAGKARRSTSTVAFFNEFGSKRIHARKWIQKANEKSADEAVKAAMKVYDNWLNSH